MKLQHYTSLDNMIKILESGYLSPPKRKGIKSWSKDFLFFSVEKNACFIKNAIYTDMGALKRHPSYFIHPTSNIYGILPSKNKKSKPLKEKEIQKFLELFCKRDQNKDGFITLIQLNRLLKDDLHLAPFESKLNMFAFSEALVIIKHHIDCAYSWEYISPRLETILNVQKTKIGHRCTIKDVDKALTVFLKMGPDTNEVGFNVPIYVKEFTCITIDIGDFKNLSTIKQEKLSELLKVYKKRGLKVKLM